MEGRKKESLPQCILRRRSALWTDRSSYDAHAQEIADFLLPRSVRFDTSDRNRGGTTHYNSIIDAHGTYAHGTMTAGFMGGLTSPARPWIKFVTPDRELMEFAPVKLWLSRLAAKMLAIKAKSNSYHAFRAIYAQLGAFGVGASVVVDDYDNVVHHHPLVFGQYAIALNDKGRTDTLYREFTRTVGQLVEGFGYDNCSRAVRHLYDRGNYDAAVKVIHAIEPRRDRDYAKRDARNMAVRSVYMEVGRDDDKVLRESGFQEFPAIVPRWEVDGDDTYASRWPAAVALGAIKQLQQEQLKKSTGIDYMVEPPLVVPMAYKGQEVDRFPGGVIYADAAGGQNTIKSAWDVRLDLNALLVDIQDVRQSIDRAFYADLFLMLANDTRATPATAREVAERHEEKLVMLGPVLESLYNEMLIPDVDLTFAKMMRAGLFAKGAELEIPRELNGQDLDVEFISTLAQAQRAVGVGAVDRYVGTLASLSAIKPEVLDKLDADQLADVYAEMLGVDPSIVVADDDVAMIRKNRAQQEQAAQMAMMAQPAKDMATAAKTASETDPNALAGLMGQFSGYAIPGVPGSPQ